MHHALAVFAFATGSLAALCSLGWWGFLLVRGGGVPVVILAAAGTAYAVVALPLGLWLRRTRQAGSFADELNNVGPVRHSDQFGVRLGGGGRMRFLSPTFLLITGFWWLAAAVTWVCAAGTGHEYDVTAIPIAFGGVMTLGVLTELFRRFVVRILGRPRSDIRRSG